MYQFGIRTTAIFIILSSWIGASSWASIEESDQYYQDVNVDLTSGLGRDHARLEGDQSSITRNYVQKLFYDEKGFINLDKVEALLNDLIIKGQHLTEELKESAILEQVEVDILSQKKATKKAEASKRGTWKTKKLYFDYIIPTITLLRDLVRQGKSPELWEGLIQDFIRAHHVFYSPNSHVTLWPRNRDLSKVAKDFLVPLTFKKEAAVGSEAINLLVEQENRDEIRACLGNQIVVGHYLTSSEIEKLKSCNTDISKINPGISGMWENRTKERIKQYQSSLSSRFPSEDVTVDFHEVMFTGVASPKIEVTATVNGELQRYKIKWGRETHPDQAISHIFYLLGYNEDLMSYRKEIKVNLGACSYEKFISWLASKWGNETVLYTILSHGGERGKEWIILRDVFLEARPQDDLRVLPFDHTSMDFSHRREFNGRLLMYSWTGTQDTKINNMKMLLAPPARTYPSPIENDNRPRILFRLQDAGYAITPSLFLNNLNKLVYLTDKYLPNEYELNGIVTLNKSKDTVAVRWNDFQQVPGLLQKATYLDLKWMARRIALLTGDEIEECLLSSGMPAEVAKLMRYKMVSRKNEIVRSFELDVEKESPYPLETIPNMSQWSSTPERENEKPGVKNGKIVKKHFLGKQIQATNLDDITYAVLGLFDDSTGLLSNWVSYNGSTAAYKEMDFNPTVNPHGIMGINSGMGLIQYADTPTQMTPIQISLGLGINATLSRQVAIAPSSLHTDRDMKARSYVVKDVLNFSIGVKSPLLNSIVSKLSLGASASIDFYEFRYEYYQYAENLKDGYLKTPLTPIFRALKNPIHEAAYKLDRMEVIRRYSSIGIAGTAGIQANLKIPYVGLSVVENSAGGTLGIVRLDDISFMRDSYGQLHVYSQDTQQKFGGVNLTFLQLNNPLASVPVFGYKNTQFNFKTFQKDSVAPQKDQILHQETPIIDDDGRLSSDLEKLKKDHRTSAEDLDHFKLNYSVEAKGTSSDRERYFLMKGKRKEKHQADITVTHSDGREQHLFRHSTERQKFTGVSTDYIDIPQIATRDLMVKSSKRVFIHFELDKHHPEAATSIIRVVDFFRKGERTSIDELIASLNRRFSFDETTPLYRDYFLPSGEDVPEYRKIYGVTRIYVSVHQLLSKLSQMDEQKFTDLAKEHFRESRELFTGTKDKDLSDGHAFFSRIWMATRLWGRGIANDHLTSDLVDHFKALKIQAMKLNRDYSKISPLLDKFFYSQKVHKFGMGLLKQIAGTESLYVASDISGVMASYSTANDLHERQRLRFAGKHWGTWSTVAPVQYYNRYTQKIAPTLLVPPHIQPDQLFGPLISGFPEDLKQTEE